MSRKIKTKKGRISTRKEPVRVTARILDSRRHIAGYIINGQRYSVPAAISLAKERGIEEMVVVRKHLQVKPKSRRVRLSDLPIRLEKSRW